MSDQNLDFVFRTLDQSRTNMVKLLSRFSPEQLNAIPNGFSNNLIWNAGHVVVTQQLLVYKLAGLPLLIDEEWVDKYRKGSKPDGNVGESDIAAIIASMHDTVKQTKADWQAGKFKDQSFTAYTTSYGITLEQADNAITFNNTHEGLHLGAMIVLAKMV
ncbi:MAG: DinB family protein [Saprospiraceae bacterium]|nr:DinB family protein [Saprospiraceae bacterium]